MAVDTAIGPEGNLLEPTPESARQIELPTPVLRNEELEKLRNLSGKNGSHGFKSVTLPMLYDVNAGGRGLEAGAKEPRLGAGQAISDWNNILHIPDLRHRPQTPVHTASLAA